MNIKNCRVTVIHSRLHFKRPAGTSRGVYDTRDVWYVKIMSKDGFGRIGIGECAPLPDLSCDALPNYDKILSDICRDLEEKGCLNTERLRPYPSILFGLETAVRHFQAGSFALWDTPFSRGEKGIQINGLIWMGRYSDMAEQIENKIEAGYKCVKLKIGAINFEEELDLLRQIRNRFSAKEIELRVDANGAFSPEEAPEKLKRLAELDIHSIEQPIRAGNRKKMAELTASTPLPIALDEELIGIHSREDKRTLLTDILPQYIILKPSLHGGFIGCNEWIEEAEKLGIGWWITSALESNIGLNAIAHYCATFNNPLPQGLGTGQLFTDNIEMPLSIEKDLLWYDPNSKNRPFSSDELSFSFDKESLLIRNKDPELHDFLTEWFDESPTMTVQTSGSTGTPKPMTVSKIKMRQSAELTCSFLHLKERDKALLCMPLQYIAGKMVVVRALTVGLDLIVRKPSGHPMADVRRPLRFAAVTPMQVYNSLQIPEEKERLMQTEILLIGGGAIDKQLSEELKKFPNAVYSSYGMTETLSHIALRRLNGKEISDHYIPFPSVKVSLSSEDTLIIEAPLVADEIVYTNDIAEILSDGSFRILGRKDNIINSGGIKIQAEEMEELLRPIIPGTFAVTSVPHPQFGEAVTLLITRNTKVSRQKLNEFLPKYKQPKYIIETEYIPLTETGKTDRAACKRIALSLLKDNI